jgi:uncharacterized protein YgbK (DUF1537 family)
VLLSESGMQHHPLTPMTDANLVRVLQAQCSAKVGLVDHRVVARGPEAIRARFAEWQRDGVSIAVVDAVSNDDLMRLGPRAERHAAGNGGLGRGDRAARQLRHRAIECRERAAAGERSTGDRVGLVLDRHHRQVRSFVDARARRSASTRSA